MAIIQFDVNIPFDLNIKTSDSIDKDIILDLNLNAQLELKL